MPACSESGIHVPYSLYTCICVTCENYPQYGIPAGKGSLSIYLSLAMRLDLWYPWVYDCVHLAH